MKLLSLNLFIYALILVSINLSEIENADTETTKLEDQRNIKPQAHRVSKKGKLKKKPITKKSIRIPSSVTNAKTTWKSNIIEINGMKINVIYNSKVNFPRIQNLVEIADKSSDSPTPLLEKDKYKGMIRKNDYIVVSQVLLLWFSATKRKEGREIKTGGGMLAGVWEIKLDPFGSPSFKFHDSNNYVKNLILPGSSFNSKLSGADVFGTYSGMNVIWGVENSQDLTAGINMGKEILSIEKGPFSADEGVFVHFTGAVTNTGKAKGIDSSTDTDPRPEIIGKTMFNLFYRIPAQRPEIIQEIQFKVLDNNFGPINSAIVSLHLPGYEGHSLSYATNPEFMPISKEVDLSDVEVNKYFQNSCVKDVYFYHIKYIKHPGKKLNIQSAPGSGLISCVGSPEKGVSYICGYPNNDYVPKIAYEDYSLEISDNQTQNKGEKIISLNYKLLSSPDKSIILKKGDQMILSMRYKFIDASSAV